MKSKGLIWEGMDADLCIFDAERICDKATFTDCNQRAEGLNYVILNGEVVVKDAVFQNILSGRFLKASITVDYCNNVIIITKTRWSFGTSSRF